MVYTKKTPWVLVIIPFVWTGLEYFRSELYFLRFSWLNVGYTFSDNLPLLRMMNLLGMYGMGFLAAILAAVLACLRPLQATHSTCTDCALSRKPGEGNKRRGGVRSATARLRRRASERSRSRWDCRENRCTTCL